MLLTKTMTNSKTQKTLMTTAATKDHLLAYFNSWKKMKKKEASLA